MRGTPAAAERSQGPRSVRPCPVTGTCRGSVPQAQGAPRPSRIGAGPPHPAPSSPRAAPGSGLRSPGTGYAAAVRPAWPSERGCAPWWRDTRSRGRCTAPAPPSPPPSQARAGAQVRAQGPGTVRQQTASSLAHFGGLPRTAAYTPRDLWTSSLPAGPKTAQREYLQRWPLAPGGLRSCCLAPELSPACPRFRAFHLAWNGSNFSLTL